MLKPSLTSWRAQYDRMQRSFERVTAEQTSSVAYDDALQHFMQDCWHLKDWIKNDPLANVGKAIEAAVFACKSLRIVADLANGSKHLDRYTHHEGAYVTSTNVTVHLGQKRAIEHEYVVTLDDGTRTTAEALVSEAVKDWDSILKKRGLIS